MLSREHIRVLLQAVAVVTTLHFAKGYMTGQYRNIMAVGLVVVVLMIVDRLLSEYEGADTKKDDSSSGHLGWEWIAIIVMSACLCLSIAYGVYTERKPSGGYYPPQQPISTPQVTSNVTSPLQQPQQ